MVQGFYDRNAGHPCSRRRQRLDCWVEGLPESKNVEDLRTEEQKMLDRYSRHPARPPLVQFPPVGWKPGKGNSGRYSWLHNGRAPAAIT